MGVISTIDYESFPKQGHLVGKRVRVVFKDDTSHEIEGECVRDDREEPHRAIFRLDDGRFVLASECQYSW